MAKGRNIFRFSTVLAVLLLLAMPGFAPALAAGKPATKPAAAAKSGKPAGGWDVVAVKSAEGAFGFCRAEMLDIQTNLTLAVALSPNGEVNFGIKVPEGDFKKGDTFPLTINITGTDWTKPATAEAGLPELLLIRLGADKMILAALAKGTDFVAKGEADETRFSLKGAGEMVETLKACVADGSAGKIGGKPPVAAAAPVVSAPAKASNGLPAGLANLLSEAKLDVTPLKTEAPQSATAVDNAWTVKQAGVTLDGGFREERVGDKTFDSLIKGTLDALKTQCKDGLKIATDKPETYPELSLGSYDLTCGTEFVALVAYRTGTGIYGQLLHRTDVAHKTAAIAARDRLAGVIRKFGQAATQAPAPK